MDLTSDQSKDLTKFIQDWSNDSTFELETSFGVGGIVDSNTFLQIAQRLRTKGFKVLPQDDYLNIITPKHVRFTIQGLGVVQSYCKDDTIKDKLFSAMLKDRAFPESNIDLKEYDIRFKIRREEELGTADPRVVDLINTWEHQQKAFRLIRRWSFEGNGIRVDMSMVRQTPNVPGKGDYQWSTTFLQKNVLAELSRYEVEVELLHDTEYTDTPQKALASLIRGVGEVQRAIQKNSLLIRNSVIRTVRSEYQQMIGSEKFRGVGPVTLQLQNMIKDIEPSIPNIREGYNVTDKADGLRAMGFINKDGEFFLIDQSLNVYRTGLQNKKCKSSLVDGEWVTLTKDGRAINHYLLFDIYYANGAKIVSDLPFATFKEGSLDKEAESRYNNMTEWFNQWRDGVEVNTKGVTDSNRLMIALKRFEFASPMNDTIFKRGCSSILDTTRIYHTDGLIITSNTEPIPKNPGVRFNQQFKWKPSKDNTVDFLISYERDPSIPTMDKVTTTIHPNSDTTIQYKTMRLYVGGAKGTEYDNPRATILFQEPIVKDKGDTVVRYKPILFTPSDFPDTMSNTCYSIVETDPNTQEDYVMTEDTKEPIPNNSIVEMRYEPQREPGWRWVPSRIRHDKTERLLRASAKGGSIKYSGMMNDEAVANSVWNSIHDPVTESMIRTGNEEPNEEEIKDIQMIRESDVAKKYYERKAPKENMALIKGLQDFHNKYIKNEILIKRSLKGGNKNLLDMACGKGGDLYKWIFNKARAVLGVDISGENITNPKDGAYKRYVETIKDFGYEGVPKVAFVIGNSSKDLVTGAAAPNPEERDMLRSMFGKVQPEGPVPTYIQNVMAGSFRAGADVAACMFAIHYFFENKTTLQGFLKNLAETVKVGGLFIGCCFDGDKVFNLLRGVEMGHSKSGKEGDVPIWTITKQYDKEDLIPDDTSVGLGIDVEFISIGSAHKEYLVSFDFLKAQMGTIGFRLLNDTELNELDLVHSTNTFDASYAMAEKSQGKKRFAMPESVKNFSFLNRWFIFKRQGEAEIPEMPAIELPEQEMEEEMKEEKEEEEKKEEDVTVVEQKPVKENEPFSRLPPPDQKFSEVEIFRFGADARQADILHLIDAQGKKDINIGRWLGIAAPFPIPDPDQPDVVYPTIEHYLAGMKLKYASTKPELAVSLMSKSGKVHQDYAIKRRTESVKAESPRDFELLAEEAVEVRKKMLKTFLNQYRVTFDEQKWIPMKDKVLMDALRYRWEKDQRFHNAVEAARNAGKYLLYSTKIASVASELGGTRSLVSSQIEGENKVGRFIMEIAGFRF